MYRSFVLATVGRAVAVRAVEVEREARKSLFLAAVRGGASYAALQTAPANVNGQANGIHYAYRVSYSSKKLCSSRKR